MTASGKAQPWYRTMSGQLSIIVIVLAPAGGTMWWVSDAVADAKELATRQDELERYSDAVADLVASLEPTVPEMLGAPFNTANKEAIATLGESAKRWAEDIELAGAKAQTLTPPQGLQPTNVVVQQSFLLYRSVVLTYRLIPGRKTSAVRRSSSSGPTINVTLRGSHSRARWG